MSTYAKVEMAVECQPFAGRPFGDYRVQVTLKNDSDWEFRVWDASLQIWRWKDLTIDQRTVHACVARARGDESS